MATWCLRAGRCDNHNMLISCTIDDTKVTCSDAGSNTFAVGSALLIFSFTDSTACAPAARSADATQHGSNIMLWPRSCDMQAWHPTRVACSAFITSVQMRCIPSPKLTSKSACTAAGERPEASYFDATRPTYLAGAQAPGLLRQVLGALRGVLALAGALRRCTAAATANLHTVTACTSESQQWSQQWKKQRS